MFSSSIMRPGGANVLYLDGHVEFKRYPSPKPSEIPRVATLRESRQPVVNGHSQQGWATWRQIRMSRECNHGLWPLGGLGAPRSHVSALRCSPYGNGLCRLLPGTGFLPRQGARHFVCTTTILSTVLPEFREVWAVPDLRKKASPRVAVSASRPGISIVSSPLSTWP